MWRDKYKCYRCTENPKLKAVWGCKERTKLKQPTFSEQINGVRYNYWNCPTSFVPSSIVTFFKIKEWYLKYNNASMNGIKDVSARYFKADQYYGFKLQEYIEKVQKNNG